MKTYLKVIYALSWVPALMIKASLALVGLLMVPFVLKFREGRFDRLWWIWGNDAYLHDPTSEQDKDGPPQWWLEDAEKTGGLPAKFPAFWWYAIRNPVGNMRFIFENRSANLSTNWIHDIFGLIEADDLVKAGKNMAFVWRYAGPFASYRRVWLNGSDKYSEIWIGWKVGTDTAGMGFTAQVRLKRPIGG